MTYFLSWNDNKINANIDQCGGDQMSFTPKQNCFFPSSNMKQK